MTGCQFHSVVSLSMLIPLPRHDMPLYCKLANILMPVNCTCKCRFRMTGRQFFSILLWWDPFCTQTYNTRPDMMALSGFCSGPATHTNLLLLCLITFSPNWNLSRHVYKHSFFSPTTSLLSSWLPQWYMLKSSQPSETYHAMFTNTVFSPQPLPSCRLVFHSGICFKILSVPLVSLCSTCQREKV